MSYCNCSPWHKCPLHSGTGWELQRLRNRVAELEAREKVLREAMPQIQNAVNRGWVETARSLIVAALAASGAKEPK